MARNSSQNILDQDVPDIGVEPLKPVKYESVKKKVVAFVKDNAKMVADWILNVVPEAVKRKLPMKLLQLISFCKSTKYKPVEYKPVELSYWQINIPNSDENIVEEKVKLARNRHSEEEYSKHLKTYYYNKITKLRHRYLSIPTY